MRPWDKTNKLETLSYKTDKKEEPQQINKEENATTPKGTSDVLMRSLLHW